MWQADFCTNNPYSLPVINSLAGHPQAMLTETYIEALLVDEGLADQVWELWNIGMIPDGLAAVAWHTLAITNRHRGKPGCFDDS